MVDLRTGKPPAVDEAGHTLVDITGLSKPADTLIKKVSAAVGGVFRPYQIKRIAKAEAEAALIRAESEIQVTDLHRRAMHRFVEEEARHQKNMEDVTGMAISHLNARADASEISDDWVTNFFDKARVISQPEMQDIWARVLAREVNKPGSFSRRTVNMLGDLDSSDAIMFTRLCGFAWNFDGDLTPVVFDSEDEIYKKNGINFGNLKHLDSIGVIQFESVAGYVRQSLPKRSTISYYEKPLALEMASEADNQLEFGQVILTQIGRELAPICGSQPVPGFFEYAVEKWKAHLPKPAALLPEGQ